MKITYDHRVAALTLVIDHQVDTCLLISPIFIIARPVKGPGSDDSLTGLPGRQECHLGQAAGLFT